MHETIRETHPTPTIPPAGPPYDYTSGATTLLPPATECDTIRQHATKRNGNSCPPACAHAREDHTTTTLSLKQIKFLHCLLTERTIAAASERAGIYRTTFYRWIKDPAFKAEYEQCRTLALTIAKAELSALSLDAADLLHECLREGYHPNVRLHAASAILKNAQRLTQANHSDPHPPSSSPQRGTLA